jgi:ribosomal protein S14
VFHVTFREIANNGLIPGVKKPAGKKKNFNWLKVRRKSEENHNRKNTYVYRSYCRLFNKS